MTLCEAKSPTLQRVDDQLYELRRKAFARGATPDDVARLAEYEQSIRARQATSIVDVAEVTAADEQRPADVESSAPEEPGEVSRARRRWLPWVAVAVVLVAIGGGFAGGWVTSGYLASQQPVSSLAVFDREQTVADTAGEEIFSDQEFAGWDTGQVYTDVRELGEFPDAKVYGALADVKDGSMGKPESLVCIAITDGTGRLVGCTSRQDFLRFGIQPLLNAAADQPSYRWGPFGPPVSAKGTPTSGVFEGVCESCEPNR